MSRIARQLRAPTGANLPGIVRFLFRTPILNRLIARLFAFGLWRVHVKQ